MSAVLDELRRETGDLHSAVEGLPTMLAVREAAGNPQAYADYLAALALSVQPLALSLHALGITALRAFLPDAEAWRAIDADLASMGRSPNCAIPVVPAIPHADHAWGRLYVVRGAEAGVALVARRQTGPGGESLPSQFASRLARHRKDWPTLCMALNDLDEPAGRRAARAAREDFAFVLDAISAWERGHAAAGKA